MALKPQVFSDFKMFFYIYHSCVVCYSNRKKIMICIVVDTGLICILGDNNWHSISCEKCPHIFGSSKTLQGQSKKERIG